MKFYILLLHISKQIIVWSQTTRASPALRLCFTLTRDHHSPPSSTPCQSNQRQRHYQTRPDKTLSAAHPACCPKPYLPTSSSLLTSNIFSRAESLSLSLSLSRQKSLYSEPLFLLERHHQDKDQAAIASLSPIVSSPTGSPSFKTCEAQSPERSRTPADPTAAR